MQQHMPHITGHCGGNFVRLWKHAHVSIRGSQTQESLLFQVQERNLNSVCTAANTTYQGTKMILFFWLDKYVKLVWSFFSNWKKCRMKRSFLFLDLSKCLNTIICGFLKWVLCFYLFPVMSYTSPSFKSVWFLVFYFDIIFIVIIISILNIYL